MLSINSNDSGCDSVDNVFGIHIRTPKLKFPGAKFDCKDVEKGYDVSAIFVSDDQESVVKFAQIWL